MSLHRREDDLSFLSTWQRIFSNKPRFMRFLETTKNCMQRRSFPSYETTVHVLFIWVVPISPRVQISIVENFLEIPHMDLLSLIGNVYNILQIYLQQWNCSESFLVLGFLGLTAKRQALHVGNPRSKTMAIVRSPF